MQYGDRVKCSELQLSKKGCNPNTDKLAAMTQFPKPRSNQPTKLLHTRPFAALFDVKRSFPKVLSICMD